MPKIEEEKVMKILKKRNKTEKVKKYCEMKEHWYKQEKLNFVISINIVATLPLHKGGDWNFKIFLKTRAKIFPIKREGLLKQVKLF